MNASIDALMMTCSSETRWSARAPTAARGARALPRNAFTLLELLLAVAVFSVVILAINVVFFSGLRLRAATSRIVEDSIPVNRAVSVIKNDLRSVLPPGGTLARTFTGGIQSSMFNNTMLSQGGVDSSSGLQFCTTTGVTDDSNFVLFNQTQIEPWPEIQKVSYYLRNPLYSTNQWGKELVRAVTRNLLPVMEDMPVEQPLLDGVERIEFLFYDGLSWLYTWDLATMQTSFQTTEGQSQTNALPQAVKILIEFAAVGRDERLRKPPIQLVVPIVAEARTNQLASASTNSSAQVTSRGNTTPGGNQNTSGGNQNTSGGNQNTGRGGATTPPASNPSSGGQRGGSGGGGRGGGR
ncbi:MAG: prepilin-type N-terminal cleavage/methylation domain-containing protein [Verrucomicrobia bacterium]|nr:prepilin-type N-terminal cleavage/methylation domain-containing protein [Verrucomicrobiota bacterium]